MALRSGRPRRTPVLVVAALVAGLVPLLASTPGQAVVPAAPTLTSPVIDAAPSYDGQTLCSTAPKPGAVKLARLLTATYGKASIGIARPCNVGGTSEHKEGRALDWMVSVRVPAQRAKANAFLSWLLKPGADGKPAEMARRLGIMYIGWNNHMWRGYNAAQGWSDLKGCTTNPKMLAAGYDTTCHRNHVHLSLSWDGAAGLTSYWTGSPLADSCTPPWQSAPAAGAGTDLVAVDPVRVLDTRRGTGLDAPCRLDAPSSWNKSGHDVVVPVAGVGGLPADGLAAVAIRVTAYRTSAPLPTIYARTTASSASIPVVSVLSSTSYSATAVVPLAADGTFRLWVDRAGADLLVDVVGYAPLAGATPSPSPSVTPAEATGRTVTVRPAVVLDTTLAPGETRTVPLAGVAPLPGSGVTGVALTLTSAPTAVAGVVGLLTPSLRAYTGLLRTTTTVATATQAFTPLVDGSVVLRNAGKAPAAVRLLVNGWTTDAPVAGGGALTVLPTAWTAVDTVAGVGLTGPATSSVNRIVTVTDGTHVPQGATGVLLAVSGYGGSRAGLLVVGSRGPVLASSLVPARWTREVVLLPLTSLGTLAVRTSSLGTQVRISVLGYVS